MMTAPAKALHACSMFKAGCVGPGNEPCCRVLSVLSVLQVKHGGTTVGTDRGGLRSRGPRAPGKQRGDSETAAQAHALPGDNQNPSSTWTCHWPPLRPETNMEGFHGHIRRILTFQLAARKKAGTPALGVASCANLLLVRLKPGLSLSLFSLVLLSLVIVIMSFIVLLIFAIISILTTTIITNVLFFVHIMQMFIALVVITITISLMVQSNCMRTGQLPSQSPMPCRFMQHGLVSAISVGDQATKQKPTIGRSRFLHPTVLSSYAGTCRD